MMQSLWHWIILSFNLWWHVPIDEGMTVTAGLSWYFSGLWVDTTHTHTYTRTYRICGHTGEERRLFIEAWQDKFKQGEAEVNVERCEPQLVIDPILKTENAALSTNLNISACQIKNARSPERVLIPLNPAFYEQIDLRYLVFISFLRCLTKLRRCPAVHIGPPPHTHAISHAICCMLGWVRCSNKE